MRKLLSSVVVCALLCSGCASNVSRGTPTPPPPPDGPDPGTDPGLPDPDPDPGPDPTTPTVCAPGDSYLFVIDSMDMARPEPGGDPNVVPGFDLDGIVSDGTGAASCRQLDWTSPDGIPGIDNQLGPALVDVPGIDVSRDLERSVRRGELILLVRVSGVEDLFDDDCVDIDILFGVMPTGDDTPQMGTDERFVSGQTFDVSRRTLFSDGRPRFSVRGASIVAGHVESKTEESVPFEIPTYTGELLDLTLHEPHISADVTENGITNGVLGGRLDASETSAAMSAVADPVLVDALVRGISDLDPDDRGVCQSVSVGVVYEGVPAVEGVIR